MVRLLTEEPQRLGAADVLRLQRGLCANCRAPLPALPKPGGFLGARSSAPVRVPCLLFHLEHPGAKARPQPLDVHPPLNPKP